MNTLDSVQKSVHQDQRGYSGERRYSVENEYIPNNNRNGSRKNDGIFCRILDKLGFTSCCNNIQNGFMTDLEVNDM